MEYKELNKQFWGRYFQARGYFVAITGNVTDEVIAHYIQNQDIEENMKSDNFDIDVQFRKTCSQQCESRYRGLIFNEE